MRKAMFAALSLVAFTLPVTAQARNILITNDDGLTSNVVALHAALEAAGHDVIVAVPCQNQSGMGAALYIARPLAPLAQPCRNDAAGTGAPGAGPMTRTALPQGDFHYVDGTPTMAMMFGLHLATGRWGAQPDLVLSGPNEGQNVGAIILTSGTVSAAQAAAVRGIPAIALSAGSNSEGADLANPISAQVAQRVVELVAALDARADGDPLLAQGLALNVNFPDELAGAEWRVTRIGSYNAYLLDFTMDMAANASPTLRAMATQNGAQLPSLPGISLDFNRAEPRPDQLNDESVVYRQHIAVSPMIAGYEASFSAEAAERHLAEVLAAVSP